MEAKFERRHHAAAPVTVWRAECLRAQAIADARHAAAAPLRRQLFAAALLIAVTLLAAVATDHVKPWWGDLLIVLAWGLMFVPLGSVLMRRYGSRRNRPGGHNGCRIAEPARPVHG